MKHWKSLDHIYVPKESSMDLGTLQVGAGFIQVPVVLGWGVGEPAEQRPAYPRADRAELKTL